MLPQKVINDPKKNLNLNIMTLRKCIILLKKNELESTFIKTVAPRKSDIIV